MKIIFKIILLFISLVQFLFASQINLTKQEQKYLKQKKVIKICIDPNWMPYEAFDKNGKYIGLSSEYFKIFSKNLNVKFEPIQTKSWKESLEYAKKRKCDLLSLAMETKSRKKYMDFTKPYLSVPLAIVTKSNVTYIDNFKQLNNKKVGITKGYAFIEIIKNKYPKINIIEYNNIDNGLKDVEKGKIFGYIDTLLTFGQKLQIDYHNILKISGKFNEKWELGTATRNDELILKNIMQKAIDSINEDKKRKILNHWLSLKVEQKIDYKNLEYFLILFLIFALISFYIMKNLFNKNKTLKKLEKELNKQKDYLNNFYTTRAFGILIVDENRKILDVNPTFCKIWQYSYNEIIGQNAEDLHINHKTFLEFGEIAFQKVLERKPIDIDYQLKKKDGSIFWAQFSGEKIKNSNNVLWVIKDITKEKEALDNFTYLFNNTMETIGLFQNGKCIGINEAGKKMFGFQNLDDVIGMPPTEFIAEDSHKIMNYHIANKSVSIYEANAKHHNGTLFPVLIKGEYKKINEIETRVVLLMDLSELKKKEKELIKAKQKAEESTKLKSEFLANMSHEIRTPMNGIMGMTYLALQTNLDNKQKNYLTTINNSAKALLIIINDILDFSKIEAGKLEIDRIDFNLKELLENISNLIKLKADEKEIKFEIDYPLDLYQYLHGDSLRIQQILINLINNAIKFTSIGYVKVSVENNKDDLYTFKVEDSGIGMSKNVVNNLFQAFTQADGSTTRKYGGTGLGLSISKQLVELMGGKIWVESKENIGSTFYFSLNLEKVKNNITTEKHHKITSKDIKTLKGSNILLTEDNETNQEIILGILENSGINIDIANNGKEAVEKVKNNQNKYELILMDIQMPIMNGIEATKEIRKFNKNIPIIALSANAMKEDRDKTKQAGMNDHLNKPIELEKLYETFLKFISKKIDNVELENKNIQEIEIPTFENMDTKIGLSHMANNKKLYLKILKDFYNSNKELKLENLNDDELKRIIHTIKGLSANIGAINLNKISIELDLTLNRELFPKFYEELNLVLNELKELQNFKKEKISKNDIISNEKQEELFNELKTYALKRRARQCNEIIEELEKYNLSKEDNKKLSKIKELIHKRKYKEIGDIL